ncbi:MAG: SPOR domain-containing protein [Candidatus Hydrogenedentes bacterium]|nr:SPOR domain-containing protein [Candidatus Hydrogenedentota bacterium]
MLIPDGKYINPELDPTARIITYKEVICYIVFLCICVIIALFVGAYLGRKSAQEKLASESKINQSSKIVNIPDEKSSDESKPTTDSSNEITPAKQNTMSPDTDSLSSGSPTTTTSPIQNPDSTEGEPSPSSVVTNTSDSSISNSDSTIPQNNYSLSQIPQTESSSKIDLVPITPIADDAGIKEESDRKSSLPISQPLTLPERKSKTYSVQLSVLTGGDAKSRAEALLKKTSQKYPQFKFTIEKAGNTYKILAINFPNDKSAREAIKLLSQENDFKGAFLIKP